MYDVTGAAKLILICMLECNKLCLHLRLSWQFVQDQNSLVYKLAYWSRLIEATWCNGHDVRLATERSWVWYPAIPLSGNNLGQLAKMGQRDRETDTVPLLLACSACYTGSANKHATSGALAKPDTTAMVTIARWPMVSHTVFSHSTYSRRHVIGYNQWSASPWLARKGYTPI